MALLEHELYYKTVNKELSSIDSKTIFEQQEQFVECGKTGNLFLAERLLAKGISIETTDIHSMTALHWAVNSEQAAAVSFLINHGANPNAYSPQSYDTPVSLAAKKGNVPILHFLLEHGGDFRYHDQRGVTLLMCAAASGSALATEYLV